LDKILLNWFLWTSYRSLFGIKIFMYLQTNSNPC
jgi:hypothetical protein